MPFRTRVHTPRSGRREGARAPPAFVPGGALPRPLASHSALRRRGMFLALEPRSRDRMRGPTARAQNGSPALPPPARPPWQVCWTLWPQGVPPHPLPRSKGKDTYTAPASSNREHLALHGLPGQSLSASRRPRIEGTCDRASVSSTYGHIRPQAALRALSPQNPRFSNHMEI